MSDNRETTRTTDRPRGQAIVELALILPIMLLLLLAALDLGRLFYSEITVNDAAREGALEASRNPTSFIANTPCTPANKDANRIMCRTVNETRNGYVTVAPADVTLTCSRTPCPPTTPALGDTITVAVSGQFRLITPLLAVFFGGQDIEFSSRASAQLLVLPTVGVTLPSASFTATPTSGTAPLAVTVADTSTGGPSSWSWDFGDGQTFAGQSPSAHTYASPGTYTITLTVTNGGGSASASQVITVGTAAPAPPVAGFTASPSTGAAPLAVTFTDTSTGSPTSWAWYFGDGQIDSVQSPPIHTYSTPGVYTARLVVTNAGGSNEITTTVNATTLCSAPVAGFTVSPSSGKKKKADFVVTDTSTNMTTSGCNNTWSWNFGDGSGNSSLQAPPPHQYNSSGTYTIQLSVSNVAGTTTATRTVTVTN